MRYCDLSYGNNIIKNGLMSQKGPASGKGLNRYELNKTIKYLCINIVFYSHDKNLHSMIDVTMNSN